MTVAVMISLNMICSISHLHLLVFCRDKLYNISTFTMEATAVYTWIAFANDRLRCLGEKEKFGEDCNVYIRSVVKNSSSLYHVCASSAKAAECRMLQQKTDVSLSDFQN